jgi:hypothetical protein
MTETMALSESVPTSPRAAVRWFFGVPLRLQTYASFLYVALAFPLGVGYFVVLVTGLALGGPLALLLVGLAVLLGLVYLVREFAAFERALADRLSPVDVPVGAGTAPSDPRGNVRYVLTDMRTWTGVVYVASKFGLGLATFVALVSMSAFSLVFTLVPLNYRNVDIGVFPPGGQVSYSPTVVFELQTWEVALTIPLQFSTWYVDSLGEALAVSAFGLFLAFASLHVVNLLAWLLGWYTRVLLGGADRSALRRALEG